MSTRYFVPMLVLLAILGCTDDHRPAGAAVIAATVEKCPTVRGIEASPLEVALGEQLLLRAIVTPPTATIAWYSVGGGFSHAAASKTLFRCERSGTHLVVLTVARDGECHDGASVSVTCTPREGGAGSGG